MGLFGWRKKGKQRVAGTAQVVSTTRAPEGASYGNLRMHLVVQAPGIPAYAHDFGQLVTSVAKWPSPGLVLPVTIDPEHHDDVEVLWDDVATGAERADQQAEQLAAMMRGEPPSIGTTSSQVTGINGITVVANQSAGDPVERLEKLAKLRAAGIVDDAQFEQLRAQILGQAGVD